MVEPAGELVYCASAFLPSCFKYVGIEDSDDVAFNLRWIKVVIFCVANKFEVVCLL
jgi:hypothetical protein